MRATWRKVYQFPGCWMPYQALIPTDTCFVINSDSPSQFVIREIHGLSSELQAVFDRVDCRGVLDHIIFGRDVASAPFQVVTMICTEAGPDAVKLSEVHDPKVWLSSALKPTVDEILYAEEMESHASRNGDSIKRRQKVPLKTEGEHLAAKFADDSKIDTQLRAIAAKGRRYLKRLRKDQTAPFDYNPSL